MSQLVLLADATRSDKRRREMAWKRLLLGNVRFEETEEFLAFKYTFGVMMMWSVLPLLVLFIIGDWSGTNRIGMHGTTVRIYFVTSCLLIWVLRGRKQWFVPVTWAFAGISYLAFISAFMFVPTDELRVVWFYSLVAGTYILLGQQAGMLFTAASIAAVALGNPYQAMPLSVRTMGTTARLSVDCGGCAKLQARAAVPGLPL